MTNKYETVDLGNVKGSQGQTGAKGVGINSIRKLDIVNQDNPLIDTYRIYYDNGETWDFYVRNGEDGDTGDSELSPTSHQPIQNRVVTLKFSEIEGNIANLSNRVTAVERFELIHFVQTLPTTDIDRKSIYVVPSSSPTTENTHEEYVWNNVNNRWEHIGAFTINLNNYYTKSDVDGKITDDIYANRNSTTIAPSVNATIDYIEEEYYSKSDIDGMIRTLQEFIHS